MKFPVDLNKLRGIPINAHPGSFGCPRKYNFHEGIDLYGDKGDNVYAIRSGLVVSNLPFTGPSEGHTWWLETNAVTVQDNDGFYIYGEIKSDLKVGDIINEGDLIGKIVPVLPDHKFRSDIPGHSVNMLHLERWNNNFNIEVGWSAWEIYQNRPHYLIDPTPELLLILQKLNYNINLLTFDPIILQNNTILPKTENENTYYQRRHKSSN